MRSSDRIIQTPNSIPIYSYEIICPYPGILESSILDELQSNQNNRIKPIYLKFCGLIYSKLFYYYCFLVTPSIVFFINHLILLRIRVLNPKSGLNCLASLFVDAGVLLQNDLMQLKIYLVQRYQREQPQIWANPQHWQQSAVDLRQKPNNNIFLKLWGGTFILQGLSKTREQIQLCFHNIPNNIKSGQCLSCIYIITMRPSHEEDSCRPGSPRRLFPAQCSLTPHNLWLSLEPQDIREYLAAAQQLCERAELTGSTKYSCSKLFLEFVGNSFFQLDNLEILLFSSFLLAYQKHEPVSSLPDSPLPRLLAEFDSSPSQQEITSFCRQNLAPLMQGPPQPTPYELLEQIQRQLSLPQQFSTLVLSFIDFSITEIQFLLQDSRSLLYACLLCSYQESRSKPSQLAALIDQIKCQAPHVDRLRIEVMGRLREVLGEADEGEQ